jgi:hypothetical protein
MGQELEASGLQIVWLWTPYLSLIPANRDRGEYDILTACKKIAKQPIM